ncbi:hypothetical protein IWW48_005407 [Coemansia sp. RSA 1200]|nr:hypothetical protein IWW48_005407 [Coemansia sp. RSA 1200]
MSGLELPLSFALIAGAGLYYATTKHVEGCKIKVIYTEEEEGDNKKSVNAGNIIRNHCPSLTDPAQAYMVPTPYLCSGMLQTVYGTALAKKYDSTSNVKYEREARTMSDGGTISMDWYPSRPSDKDDTIKQRPIFVFLPGLGGSSQEYHIRSTAKTLSSSLESVGPCTVVVMNHRGSARTPLTSPRLYNAYDTTDYADIVQYVSECFPEAPLVGVGFSLGANLVTKYLGEQGSKTPLIAAAAICCPFDTEIAGREMDKPGFLNDRVFQPNLMATLKRALKRNINVFKTKYSDSEFDAIMRVKRMSHFDNLVTCKEYGHADCWDYYRAASSTAYVDNITIPFLAINTEDDPVTPFRGVPVKKFQNNPNLALVQVKHGGHLGLFTGLLRPSIWYLQPVAEFLGAILSIKKE